MIKKSLTISFLLVSAGVAAQTSCPTCPKGYAVSKIEEVLVANNQQLDAQKALINQIPQKRETTQQKTPSKASAAAYSRAYVTGSGNHQPAYKPKMPPPSHAPKGDAILRGANYLEGKGSPLPNATGFSSHSGRNTFDATMAMAGRPKRR